MGEQASGKQEVTVVPAQTLIEVDHLIKLKQSSTPPNPDSINEAVAAGVISPGLAKDLKKKAGIKKT